MIKQSLSLITALVVVGCTNTPIGENVDTAVSMANRRIEEAQKTLPTDASAARRQNGVLIKDNRLFVATKSIPIAQDAQLPDAFRRSTFRFAERLTLPELSERITQSTGIPVRIAPDVLLPVTAFARGRQQTAITQSNTTGNATPLPGGQPNPSGNLGNAPGGPRLTNAQYSEQFSVDYGPGPLAGLLDSIAARANFSWEYRDGSIHLFRLLTRSYELKTLPVASSISNSTGSNSQATSGTGGASSGGAGSATQFTGQNSTQRTINLDPYAEFLAQVTGLLSRTGSVSSSRSTGTFTVTDTRDVHNDVARLIEIENARLTKQMRVRIDFLSVSISENDSRGIDWEVLFSNIRQGSTATITGAPSLVGAAGAIGAKVIDSTKPFSGTSLIYQYLNQYGKVYTDKSYSQQINSRTPIVIADQDETAYVDKTVPSTGGGLTTGAVVPGISTAKLTTGYSLNVFPVLLDSNNIQFQFSVDISSLKGTPTTFESGSGATLQRVQIPNITRQTFQPVATMRPNETLVLATYTRMVNNRSSNSAFGVGSATGNQQKEQVVILVTPYVGDDI